MGFRGESQHKRQRGGPRRANGLQMILIFIAIGAAVFLGYWAPLNLPFHVYLPIPVKWYEPIIKGLPVTLMQVIVGVVVFILLQFLIVMISGLLFPLEPEEMYDKDGFYLGKREK